MGETAGRLADFTILTSDNPRWEDPELILDDIESGIKGTRGAYIRIADRRAAVAYAFDHAREGDIIVLAGKGMRTIRRSVVSVIRWRTKNW